MVTYYEVRKRPTPYHNLPICGTEAERGLNEPCKEDGEHAWLVLPKWSLAVLTKHENIW